MVKERIYLDKSDQNLLHDENAFTLPLPDEAAQAGLHGGAVGQVGNRSRHAQRTVRAAARPTQFGGCVL